MKYLLTATGYSITWVILTVWLIIERFFKILSIIVLVLWFLEYKEKWHKRLKVIGIAIPIEDMELAWQIKGLRDYYLMKNWKKIEYGK